MGQTWAMQLILALMKEVQVWLEKKKRNKKKKQKKT